MDNPTQPEIPSENREAQNQTKAKRGRPGALPISDKIASLEAQLAAAKAEAKEAEYRRFAIVGRVVLDAAAKDQNFNKLVRELLRTKVKGQRDLADIAPLLTD